MEALQQFNKGMNRDLSFALYQKETYWDMLNMRLVTSDGLSTGNPVNVRGNLLYITIPDTSNVSLLTAIRDPDGSPQSIDVDAGAFGFQTFVFTFDSNWEKTLVDLINNDSIMQAANVKAVYKEGRVVIYVTLVNNVLPYNQVDFTGFSITTFNADNSYVTALDNLQIMGWEVIRDEIFLFTASDPADNFGQIWKFTYDVTGVTPPVITLVYDNALNFSLDFPIANPGGIVGNYEGTQIKKLYWTDNNHRPRVINVEDPNVMALDPNLIDLQSLINFSIPILQKIGSGGALKTGLYQYAYRLSMSTGQQTVFSQTSSLIPINSHLEATESYIKYVGVSSGISTSKSIEMQINNVDTNYETIEIIAIYYSTPNATPTIEIIKSEPIPDSGIYTFVHTGTEVGIPITLDEFNIINTVILKAKTLTSKNNFLFEGNLKESIFDVPWDGRAYRFNSGATPESFLADKAGNLIQVDPLSTAAYPDQWNVSETYDAINPNQEANTIGLIGNPNPFIYQTDGVTFGGEGVNIKYSFVEQRTNLDSTVNNTSLAVPDVLVNRIQKTYNFDNYTRVNPADTFIDFHSPYLDAQLKGYTRGEIYRFGIVWFDLEGNQSYVKWIGDIQFPNAYMPDTTDPLNPAAKLLTFSPSFVDLAQGLAQANNLGINFTIKNIPAGCTGFSIVRCERTNKDKTILGQGIFNLGLILSGCTQRVMLVDDGKIGSNYDWNNTIADNTGVTGTGIDGIYGSVQIPEHLFNTVNFGFSNGDTVELLAKLENVNQGEVGAYEDASTNQCTLVDTNKGRNLYFLKNYQYSSSLLTDVSTQGGPIYNALIPLQGNAGIEPWSLNSNGIPDTAIFPGAIQNQQIYNLSVNRGSTCEENLFNQGINCLAVASIIGPFNGIQRFGTPGLNRATQDGILGSPDMYLVNYKRVVASQYGGNSYSERSNSEYISTGQYQPLNGSSSYQFSTYGGDTFINILDINARKKHFTEGDGFTFSPGGSPYDHISTTKTSFSTSVVRFFPVETTVNIDLRQTLGDLDYTCGTNGRIPTVAIPNKTNFNDALTDNVVARYDTLDEFIYNPLYSKENNIRRFFPKSTDFISDGIYDVRVRVSQKKTNNEQTDSWTIFKAADYIDIDTIQGPIINLMVHQDRLFAFQEKGISVLSVNERSLIQDNSGAELVLGTGGVLTRFDYISKVIGSQHQFGFTQSNDAIFFFDMNTKNLYKITGNSPVSLSVAKGMTSYFGNNLNGPIQINDNPYRNKGITATYDFHYNEALMTFKDEGFTEFTIAYNDFIDAFQTRYTFTPRVYVNDKKSIFSPQIGHDLWRHDVGDYCNFYGNTYESRITLLLNPYPAIRKVWDTYQFETDVVGSNNVNIAQDTFNRVRIYNDNQNSDTQDYPIDILTGKVIGRRLEKFWNISNLRNRVIYPISGNVDPLDPVNISATDIPYSERMRSPYLFVDLIYDNLNNRKLTLNTFKSDFRMSAR